MKSKLYKHSYAIHKKPNWTTFAVYYYCGYSYTRIRIKYFEICMFWSFIQF